VSHVYFAVHTDRKAPYLHFEEIGYWFSYHVYKCESHLLAVMSFDHAIFMNESVALAWKFAGANRPFIRISGGESRQKNQLPPDSLVPYKPEKVDYVMTDEDLENAVSFMKKIAKDMASRYADNRWKVEGPRLPNVAVLASLAGVSSPLKKNATYFAKLEEIAIWLGRIIGSIESCKTVAECNETIKNLQVEMGL